MVEMPKRYDPHEAEKKWMEYWEKEGIFRFDPKIKERDKIFAIDTPPPTVSGTIHMGHAFGFSQADFIARYKKMRGYNLFYPFGYDDNGLATELFVRKIKGVLPRDMSREDYVKLVLEVTEKAEREFEKLFKRMAMAFDWNLVYRTISPEVTEISQLSFIELYEMGRAYRKEDVTIWCPSCETAIAQVEMEDRKEKAKLYYIRFDVEGGESITIATTRPELMPACVAIYVHPEDERYRHLIGKRAKLPIFGREVPIMANEDVDMEYGTGVVYHCTFGDYADIEWARAFNTDIIIVIDKQGRMNEKAGKYAGLTVREARERIVEDLKKEGRVLKEEDVEHVVNVHERCGTPIEFRVTKQWFIRYLDLREKWLELGRELKWYPEHMRTRYENWVRGLKWDWCISRQRKFGVPFPVWYCKRCGEIIVANREQLPVDPFKDKPLEPCPKCGSTEFIPEQDVMDTWATSSLTPLINAGWEGDNKGELMNTIYPMDLRPQGHDIISFWLFNTVVKCYLHTGKLPWKATMINGHALDPHGRKMSKSKGNVIDPREVMDKYCADALRYWASGTKLGDDLPFQEKDVQTAMQLINKLWNASRFVLKHLEDYRPESSRASVVRAEDAWILVRLSKVIKEVTELFEAYEYAKARKLTEQFFWYDLCDNYLEMVKQRLYNRNAYNEEEISSAQYCLYHSLLAVLKMLAPIMPYITEEIYSYHSRQVESKRSIHEASWPSPEPWWENGEVEQKGNVVVSLLSAIRQFKNRNRMPLNAEIKELILPEELKAACKEFEPCIMETAKVKKIKYGDVSSPSSILEVEGEEYPVEMRV